MMRKCSPWFLFSGIQLLKETIVQQMYGRVIYLEKRMVVTENFESRRGNLNSNFGT